MQKLLLFPIFFFTSFPFSFAPIQSLIQKILLSIYRVHSLGCKILMVTRSTAPVLLLLSRDDGVCTSGQIVMSHYTLQKNVGRQPWPHPGSKGAKQRRPQDEAGSGKSRKHKLLSKIWASLPGLDTELPLLHVRGLVLKAVVRKWEWPFILISESRLQCLVVLGHHVTSFNHLFHSVLFSLCVWKSLMYAR